MSDEASALDTRRYVPYAIVGGGGLLVAASIALGLMNGGLAGLLTPVNLAAQGVSLFLSAVVVAAGVVLARSDIPADRYSRAGWWTLVGAGVLLLANLPLMLLVPGLSLEFALGWAYNVIATGAAAGSVIGLSEARAIERAREAERASVRASASEAERERLEYLNSLLRHEVLNNVNIIHGYAELAAERSDPTVEDHLQTIQRRSEAMEGVISDIRVLIEALDVSDPTERVDLAAVLTEVLSDLERDHEVSVETSVPEGVYVRADGLLHRVFDNLLANAVEHHDGGIPEVGVTVVEDDSTVTVHVADDGPGISPEVRDSMFTRTVGADHGLGLYLVRELVVRYGGRVELAETGPEGTVFAVTLPKAAAPPPGDEPSRAERAQHVAAVDECPPRGEASS